MDKSINLIKLCVGAKTVQDLLDWQAQPRAQGPDGLPRHITRMWPKREAEILNGGSIYWVFKGVVLCRQKVQRFDEYISADGIRRCAIVLDKEVTRVAATPRRPFQGWRYLPFADAPPDLSENRLTETPLPPALNAALMEIGVV
ncbi:MAG: DUF1489 domain-containing protein [Pseudomonadota bacterium]